MKKTLLAAALLTGTLSAVTINSNVNRTFVLTSPTASTYLTGSTNVTIIDGSITLSPCFQPSPFVIPPNPGCPLGTTAFIQAGDVDGDGVVDDRSYWSVASVQKGTIIEPYYPIAVTLSAAPPSKLTRPLGDFRDNSLGVFYNILGGSINLYEISSYRYNRQYDINLLANAYQLHAEQWVPGVYVYSIPIKGQIGKFAALRMTITSMVEANGYRKGLRGFGLNNINWANNAYELDPRLISTLQWTGNTISNTIASDVVEFAMRNTDGDIVYPVPNTPYRLDSPYLTKLNILPYVFNKGDIGTSQMTFSRSLSTSGIASDTSTRSWAWNNRFIDTYKGHDLYEYRLTNDAAITGIKVSGNPSQLRSPTADYDGDGLSNIMEFAYTQDDGDDISTTLEWTSYHNSTPPSALVLASLGLTAPSNAAPVFLDTAASGVPNTALVTSKRRNVGAAITYGYEINYNTADPRSRWVRLATPRPGQTLSLRDKKAATISGDPLFTWTIIDTFDTILPAAAGTTSIQASAALPATVRIRSTAAVTKGY
jgi:hypothetical protein